ncbi:MAG TPA: hypothetical protein VJW55_16845, partial [Candidatus Angelobacter sp.]|nr:hypothetical protein [Candidatus Angelobacter sp.]
SCCTPARAGRPSPLFVTMKTVVVQTLQPDSYNRGVKTPRIGIAAFLALIATLMFAEKHFNPPPAAQASTYPIHETHKNENVTIAVDPCDTPEKAGVFKVNYKGYGFYPVRLIISNDSDQTLMLQNLKIEYITAQKDKVEPASDADIYRRLVRPSKANNSDPGIKLPFPVGKKKQPISKEVRDEYESAQFLTVPVTPHSTNSGYLFFDLMDLNGPHPGAHLYLTGIKAESQELFYFDIPLDKPPQDTPSEK